MYGHCPQPVWHDASAPNWRRKRDIFARSRLHLATPCHWLMRKVEQSILAPAVVSARVISNGIDLGVFRTVDRIAARTELRLPPDRPILLFAANQLRANFSKDFGTLMQALARIGEPRAGAEPLFLALGETAPSERIGRVEVRYVPFEPRPDVVARYYQSADIYVHAARAETQPLAVMEAMACGTAVIASAVGGIPEELEPEGGAEVGMLVPSGDAVALAEAIGSLLHDPARRRAMGETASGAARRRFSTERQAAEYLQWYEEILSGDTRAGHDRRSHH
jgi:glycosyltransferase involved in cell wall biosynthesis